MKQHKMKCRQCKCVFLAENRRSKVCSVECREIHNREKRLKRENSLKGKALRRGYRQKHYYSDKAKAQRKTPEFKQMTSLSYAKHKDDKGYLGARKEYRAAHRASGKATESQKKWRELNPKQVAAYDRRPHGNNECCEPGCIKVGNRFWVDYETPDEYIYLCKEHRAILKQNLYDSHIEEEKS